MKQIDEFKKRIINVKKTNNKQVIIGVDDSIKLCEEIDKLLKQIELLESENKSFKQDNEKLKFNLNNIRVVIKGQEF